MSKHRFVLTSTLLFSLIFSTHGYAHLCNDVFAQAQDNLAVKVDVRDGQLRISEEASFRVYLLNTMDRDIVSIKLEVLSDEFSAEVSPSPEWQKFPRLRTITRGGEKVYFNVKLQRKPDVPDGRYEIGLRLFNGKNRKQEFKTVDLAAAAGTHRVTGSPNIKVDGEASRTEWGDAVLCTGFNEYVKRGRYFENREVQNQSRFRVTASDDYLYCMLAFVGGENAQRDIATLYVASSREAEPVNVEFHRIAGKITFSGDKSRIKVSKSANGQVLECRIPRDVLNIEDTDNFYVNFTRTLEKDGDKEISYWRGNKISITNPVVYDKFVQR